METSELKNKIVKGVFHNYSGALLKNGITFIISIFLSRILNPSDFGLIGMATVFITFAQGLSDLGLSSGLIKEKNPTNEEMSSVFYFNIAISVVMTLTLFFSAGIIAEFYKTPEIEMIVKAISFTFVLNSLNTVHKAILYKNIEIKISRISTIISAILSGIVGLAFAYMGYGVWSLIYSSYAGGMVSVLITWSFLKWKPKLVFNIKDIKKLMPFGIKVFAVNYLEQVYSKMDVVVIGKMFSPAILGYFFRASSLNQLITKYSSQGLSGIFFPAISMLNGNIQQITLIYKKSLHAICFLSFLITGLLYLNARPLILFLFSEKWLPAVGYFKIMAFSSFALPLTIIFNGVLLGTGNSGTQLKLELIKKVMGVVGLVIGFYFGIMGYLWSMTITATLSLMLSFFSIGNILKMRVLDNVKSAFSYLIPLVVAALIVVFLGTFFKLINIVVLLFFNSLLFTLVYAYISHKFNLLGFSIIYNVVKDIFVKSQ